MYCKCQVKECEIFECDVVSSRRYRGHSKLRTHTAPRVVLCS